MFITLWITQNRSYVYIFVGVTAVVSLELLGSLPVNVPTEVQAKSDLSIKISMHEDEVERGETQSTLNRSPRESLKPTLKSCHILAVF